MEDIIPDLTDWDQTGFIQNRQTQDNIRRTLHVMDHITQNKSTILISLAAEKSI